MLAVKVKSFVVVLGFEFVCLSRLRSAAAVSSLYRRVTIYSLTRPLGEHVSGSTL